MKRVLTVSLITLLAAGSAGAQAAKAPPRAALTHFSCRQAQNPSHRVLSVTAVMRPVANTAHLAIKFTLLRQAAGASSFRPVRSGDLGHWIYPRDPTLGQRPGDVWEPTKVIKDLAGPAVYRLKVEFRWTDAHDRVLANTLRGTSICRAD